MGSNFSFSSSASLSLLKTSCALIERILAGSSSCFSYGFFFFCAPGASSISIAVLVMIFGSISGWGFNISVGLKSSSTDLITVGSWIVILCSCGTNFVSFGLSALSSFFFSSSSYTFYLSVTFVNFSSSYTARSSFFLSSSFSAALAVSDLSDFLSLACFCSFSLLGPLFFYYAGSSSSDCG